MKKENGASLICRLGRVACPRSSCKFGRFELSIQGRVPANLERGQATLPNLQINQLNDPFNSPICPEGMSRPDGLH
jgi:hypothetical protein